MYFNLFKRKKFGEVDLKCPRCNVVMKKLKKKHVIIDVCQKCKGMWLDDKEIDKLVKITKGDKHGKK